MRWDLSNNIEVLRAIVAQTITSSNLVSGNLDLAGASSAAILVEFGDIAEMGASPEGSSKIDVHLEHADDDGTGSPDTYADVEKKDVTSSLATVTGGIVLSPVSDLAPVKVGYIGGKRFIRVTLEPTDLSSGGPVTAILLKGHTHDKPAS